MIGLPGDCIQQVAQIDRAKGYQFHCPECGERFAIPFEAMGMTALPPAHGDNKCAPMVIKRA